MFTFLANVSAQIISRTSNFSPINYLTFFGI